MRVVSLHHNHVLLNGGRGHAVYGAGALCEYAAEGRWCPGYGVVSSSPPPILLPLLTLQIPFNLLMFIMKTHSELNIILNLMILLILKFNEVKNTSYNSAICEGGRKGGKTLLGFCKLSHNL